MKNVKPYVNPRLKWAIESNHGYRHSLCGISFELEESDIPNIRIDADDQHFWTDCPQCGENLSFPLRPTPSEKRKRRVQIAVVSWFVIGVLLLLLWYFM